MSFFGDRGRARKLVKLADRTIAMMKLFEQEMPPGQDRELLSSHLVRRRSQRARYDKIARDDLDQWERLDMTMRSYDIWKRSMENELSKFSRDSATFVWYLKQIKQE